MGFSCILHAATLLRRPQGPAGYGGQVCTLQPSFARPKARRATAGGSAFCNRTAPLPDPPGLRAGGSVTQVAQLPHFAGRVVHSALARQA